LYLRRPTIPSIQMRRVAVRGQQNRELGDIHCLICFLQQSAQVPGVVG
jgi:hypothetical protein